MEIGFLESVSEQPNGSLFVSGWSRASSVEIALVWDHRPDPPVFLLKVRPDVTRTDVPDVPSAGFQLTIGNTIRALLPRSMTIVASADGELLHTLPAVTTQFDGMTDSLVDVEQRLHDGFCWHRKTGQWYLPISRWTDARRSATVGLLTDVVAASERMLTPAKGTLLGLVRSGSLLPHDDDVDAAAYLHAESIDELAGRWSALIASTAQLVGARPSFADDLFHVLLTRGEGMIDCWPVWMRPDGTFVDVHGPGRADDLTPIEAVLDRQSVWIPRLATQVLEHGYGRDFLVPDTSWRPESLQVDDHRRDGANHFRSVFNAAMVRQVTVA